MSEKKLDDNKLNEEKIEISGTDSGDVKALSDSELDSILNTDEITDTPIADIEVDLESDDDFIVTTEEVAVKEDMSDIIVDNPVAEAVTEEAVTEEAVTEEVVTAEAVTDLVVDSAVIDDVDAVDGDSIALASEVALDIDDDFEDETISISNSDLNRILQETETVEAEVDAISINNDEVVELGSPVTENIEKPVAIEDSIVEMSGDELVSEGSEEAVIIATADEVVEQEASSDEVVFEEMTVDAGEESLVQSGDVTGMMSGEVPLTDSGIGEVFVADGAEEGVSDEIIIPSELDEDPVENISFESSAFSDESSQFGEPATVAVEEEITLEEVGEPATVAVEEEITLEEVGEPATVAVEEEITLEEEVGEPATVAVEEEITLEEEVGEPATVAVEEEITLEEEVGEPATVAVEEEAKDSDIVTEEVINLDDEIEDVTVSNDIEIVDNLDLEDENEEIIDEELVFAEDETIPVESEVVASKQETELELEENLEEPISVEMGQFMGEDYASVEQTVEEEIVEADIFNEDNGEVSDDFSDDEIADMHEEIFSQHESIPEVIETSPVTIADSPVIPAAAAVAVTEDVATSEIVQGLTDETKEDVKTVLSYLDNLFDDLPDDKVKEFAGSEYYDIYNRLFKKLGI